MPADIKLSQDPTDKHGSAAKPYPCHGWSAPPGADWAIDYGYCRNSLDYSEHGGYGSKDGRCPGDCQHKAPQAVALHFSKIFAWQGAKAAAAIAVAHRKAARCR